MKRTTREEVLTTRVGAWEDEADKRIDEAMAFARVRSRPCLAAATGAATKRVVMAARERIEAARGARERALAWHAI